MIDFHTHILPGIDDGAKDVGQSVALLNSLEEQGVDTVILTPHYYGRNKSIDKFLTNRDCAYESLVSSYRGKLRLIRACECNLSTCANNDYTDLKYLAIENTDYILTEFSFEKKWDGKMWSKLNGLLDAGLIPVIAHVELYPAIVKQPGIVYDLIETGCLIQINCDSVADKKRNKLVKALINHNQVHCLGSDAHNLQSRPPHYKSAVDLLKTNFGDGTVDYLQKNMQKIIAGETVSVRKTEPVNRGLFGKLK